MDRWIVGAIMGAIVVMMAAGCGANDSTTALTKAELTDQASAICAEGERNIETASAEYDKIVKSTPGGTSDVGFQRDAAKEILYRSILPSMQEELEHLEATGAQAGDVADISKLTKTLSQAIEEFEDVGPGLPTPEQYVRFQRETKASGLDCST